uniref:Endonuclease/exonuclease/phosphatase domain-containing protein n=1 Tax=Plectus sambesii TaxID=2011161 RepID=A0A914UZ50_9BILA
MSSRNNAYCPHLSDATSKKGLPRDGLTRLTKLVQPRPRTTSIRFASINIGSMTSHGRELADVLKKRRVHVACVQEVKWKGEKSRNLGAGYKLIYYGTTSGKNGVGVILNEPLSDKVLEVTRVTDRLMSVKIDLPDGAIMVVSAYAPQVGCPLEEKEQFWEIFDNYLQNTPDAQNILIGDDLNGHVGARRDEYDNVHGSFGYGTRNTEGETILNAAIAYDLAVANTYFQKSEEHLITYKSSAGCTQIDYLLVHRSVLRENWQQMKQQPDHKQYLEAKRAVKRIIATAKTAHYQDLYNKLDTKEGKNAVYHLACARNGETKDIQMVKTIKGPDGVPLQKENNIQDHWGEYYKNLLNEENPGEPCNEVPPVLGPIHAITRVEVKNTQDEEWEGSRA